MKFKSVLEMVKKISSNSFYNKWIGNWPRRIIENYQFDPMTCISSYQGYCRFYLDDYKEQEELREEWFKKFPRYGKSPALEFFQNRFMRKN